MVFALLKLIIILTGRQYLMKNYINLDSAEKKIWAKFEMNTFKSSVIFYHQLNTW